MKSSNHLETSFPSLNDYNSDVRLIRVGLRNIHDNFMCNESRKFIPNNEPQRNEMERLELDYRL